MTSSRVRLAVDAMGGDRGPAVIVEGALAAARDLGVEVVLVGASAVLTPLLAELLAGMPAGHPDSRSLPVTIVEAPDVIAMSDPPTSALRRPGASIRVAADLVASGGADALFSAGHTGASVLAAHSAFGMLPTVDRPALATTIPTRTGSAVLLDAGANAECRPHHLLQFGVMGSAYARLVLGIERPRVGLLSIGEEETKGNELTREAHQLLKAGPVAFIGNVEGREIYSGAADVVVCDGFTGNVVLKTSEGLVEMLEATLGAAFHPFRQRLDYAEYGGAPLLGVAGVAVIGHGRSSAKAVRNAIGLAQRVSADQFIRRVTHDLGEADSESVYRQP